MKFNTLYQANKQPPQRVETALSEPHNSSEHQEKLLSSTKDFLSRSSTARPTPSKPSIKHTSLASYSEKRATLERAADVASVQALP